MSCRRPLQFLRPPPALASPATKHFYLRFYSVARRFAAADPHTAPLLRPRSSLRAIESPIGCRYYAKQKNASDIDEADLGSRVIIEKRIQKLEEYEALRYPRIACHENCMRIPDFVAKYSPDGAAHDGEVVVLRGRVMSRRAQGSKLVYLDVLGEFQKVQVKASLAELSDVTAEDFKRCFHPVLRGDIVEVAGIATRSGTGELTLQASRLPTVLTPSLAPLPRKVQNDETRVLNRHVDLLVNQETADVLRTRSHVIRAMRDFFHERNFLEVQTPIMADYAGGATARPFLTTANEFSSRDLALRIAPELWLKRLVVGGMERVFEIGPSFRNEGLDNTHNPEFTTCEFYWAYANLAQLTAVTEHFVRSLFSSAQALHERLGRDTVLPELPNEDFAFPQFAFLPTLERILDIRFPDLSEDTAFDKLVALLGDRLPPAVSQERSLTRLLDHLAGTYIEPFSETTPIFITHHPACMSPLAKSFVDPASGSQAVSARAELFIRGREIANMYEEENDPLEQRRKLEEQVRARRHSALEAAETPAEVDESYVQALEYGLPPTGGWGCGVDRLVMLLSGTQRIADTLTFGSLRNVVSVSQAVKRN
ncbi:lysyl-tRNA synthetase class II [Microdochium nivale]|nr:lysyl-tRNA synthetase class II [Microdochium nivale]